MICTLCNRDADQVIRVDGWQVCNWCIRNKVLEHAIDVREVIRKLTAAVATATIKHREDSKRVREARDRLQGAYADLATAIKNLAALNTESQESLVKSLDAVEALKEYRDTESEATRKAREHKNE